MSSQVPDPQEVRETGDLISSAEGDSGAAERISEYMQPSVEPDNGAPAPSSTDVTQAIPAVAAEDPLAAPAAPVAPEPTEVPPVATTVPMVEIDGQQVPYTALLEAYAAKGAAPAEPTEPPPPQVGVPFQPQYPQPQAAPPPYQPPTPQYQAPPPQVAPAPAPAGGLEEVLKAINATDEYDTVPESVKNAINAMATELAGTQARLQPFEQREAMTQRDQWVGQQGMNVATQLGLTQHQTERFEAEFKSQINPQLDYLNGMQVVQYLNQFGNWAKGLGVEAQAAPAAIPAPAAPVPDPTMAPGQATAPMPPNWKEILDYTNALKQQQAQQALQGGKGAPASTRTSPPVKSKSDLEDRLFTQLQPKQDG